MWGNRKEAAGGVGAVLESGAEIEGKYTSTGTVTLDAKLRGEITSTDTLIIEESGVVEATVQAAIVVVHGAVVGNVTASKRVELKGTARVRGDLEAPVLVVEAGAVLDGRCKITTAGPAEARL